MPLSATIQQRVCLFAGATTLLVVILFVLYFLARRKPLRRRQSHLENFIQPNPTNPPTHAPNQTIQTIRYQGEYAPFKGAWHRMDKAFTGVRGNYTGYTVDHLNNELANIVWLHEARTLAIYDQHLYTYIGNKVTNKMFIWSIGKWNAETGGAVHTDRHAYAVVDVAKVPNDFPAENLIVLADVYGGAGWGGIPEAELGGSLVDANIHGAPSPQPPPPPPPPPPPQAATTPPPTVLRWRGQDVRLAGLWRWQRESIWYNEQNKLALIKDQNEPHWRIQAWTPEQDRLGIATGGILLSSAEGTLSKGNNVLSVTTPDGIGFQPAVEESSISNYTAFPYRPQVMGYTAGARRRVDLKDRVSISRLGRQSAARNTTIG